MKNMWDERYGQEEYAYGKTPNAFFKSQIDLLQAGRILLPAEGEGRNAIYAAQLGWEVHAIDQSAEGQRKALQLANEKDVKINYQIGNILNLNYAAESFDLIALTYVHMPSHLLKQLHQQLMPLLKPKGHLLVEGFSVSNLSNQRSGQATNGPRDSDFLFDKTSISNDFISLRTKILTEEEIDINEGIYHQGKANIIRFLGQK